MVRVAVLDADPLERVSIAASLRRGGHDVREWFRAESALSSLLERAPDLLIVAADLPDASGLDVVARLRARHVQTFPIVLVSADARDRVRARGVGATEHWVRPVDAETVPAALERLLRAGAGGGFDLPRGPDGLAFGRYEVRDVLGRGTFGVVYDAWDPRRGEEIALKVLTPPPGDPDDEAEAMARFVREARVLSRVRAPHVVSMLDAGIVSGRAFCAMRRVHGLTLDAYLQREGPLSELQALALLWGLLSALDALAEHDLVHRDITPRNVLLERERLVRPMLIDFGLAKRALERGLTADDTLLGTPGFIAPEVILGSEADARSDLFSTGIVVLHALEGRHPFPRQRATALLRTMAEVRAPLPTRLSARVQDLLARLTALEPRERPASARVALEELADLARDLTAAPAQRRLTTACA